MDAATERQEAVFYAALKVAASGRKAFLDSACAGDGELRAVVEEMLAAQTDAELFFADGSLALEPAADELLSGDISDAARRAFPVNPPADEHLGARIGHYRLLEKIGEGGCGAVYMGEQQEPVRRKVAFKIIKLGMDTKNVIARFEAERQALALMDHPNIARVLDAGATDTGRPYFVMELVRGIKITDYCDQNQLDTGQRLDLFCQVCHAIQHAHQKGIIHRDIKPSNILVTRLDGRAVPKVIDFGIAKAIEEPLTDKTLFTAYNQVIGTPAYMSPEQAEMNWLDVDTRSDIYSLGVLLYELLTGKTPFDARELMQSGLDGMRRKLREEEPHRPSTKLGTLHGTELTRTAEHRHVEPPKLVSLLQGDLDWIVMKALEKDRARRYETANGLAMDVRRYLDNEPVIARPPSRLYRFRKLVQRNRVTFVAALAVAAALIAGLGMSTWLFLKEKEARREAERGRANETLLRQQAEAREKIMQAAMLVGQNRYEEADQVIAQIVFPAAALEGAPVFRSLGDRAALQGRWGLAVQHFNMLLRVDQIEAWDVSTLDYSRASVAIAEQGDAGEYARFRRAALKQFAGTVDPIIAERTVKNCLLLPADESVLSALAPLADLAAKSFSGENPVSWGDGWMAPWRCLSLALMDYRRGNGAGAVAWGTRCLSYGDDCPARVAAVRTILAMSCHQLGRAKEARDELARSREMIENKYREGLDAGNGTQGYWFDWELGRILLREAEATLQAPLQQPPSPDPS